MSEKHTPLPWHVPQDDDAFVMAGSSRERFVACCQSRHRPEEEDAANAALIVRAVNSHHALLALLEEALPELQASVLYSDELPGSPHLRLKLIDRIEQAIARQSE